MSPQIAPAAATYPTHAPVGSVPPAPGTAPAIGILTRADARREAVQALRARNIRDYAARIRATQTTDRATRVEVALRSWADPAAVLAALLTLPGVCSFRAEGREVVVIRTAELDPQTAAPPARPGGESRKPTPSRGRGSTHRSAARLADEIGFRFSLWALRAAAVVLLWTNLGGGAS